MSSLTIRTDYKTAATILHNIYQADRSSTYSNKKRTVTGGTLSAAIKYDTEGCYIEMASSYYTLASLREISGVDALKNGADKAKEVRRLLNEDEGFRRMTEI